MSLHIKIARKTITVFLISFVLISFIGGSVATRGRKVPVTTLPTTTYEEVLFKSEAKDQVNLNGWFFSAPSKKVVIVAHGWGGNRSTFLNLAEYLQTHSINVLTLDLRGGTGKNTYGQHEQGDIGGAVTWLKEQRQFSTDQIIIIGNSMGGAASIGYAATHETAGLILISSVIDLNHTRQYFARDYHLLFPSVYAYGVSLVERYVYKVQPDNPKDIFSDISEPTLILHGSSDEKASITDVYALKDSLSPQQSARTQFIIAPDGTHTFFIDSYTTDKNYNEPVLQFIQKISPES